MKKISVLLAALLLCAAMTGCASRRPFEKERFVAAAEPLGYEVVEPDPAALGQPDVLEVAVATKEDQVAAQVVILATDAGAKALYANMVSSLAGGKEEKRVDSSPYNKLYVQNGSTFCAVIRVGPTLFFGQDQGGGEVKALLKALGVEN